jgi:hypothetical protein
MMEDRKSEERRKEILDTMKVPAFIEQAKKELGDGTITGVQAGTVAPGASTLVNARTNDGLGVEWGRKEVQTIIDGVNNNATLIQDPTARTAYLKEERAKLIAKIPKENGHFLSGAVITIDKEINSFENKWQAQSNAYHIEVQSKDFSGKVIDAIKSDNPDQALMQLDDVWKNSSALSNVRRNELVVETVVKQAIGDRNIALLEKIPERFLNAETKAAISKTRAQITEMRFGDFSKERQIQAYQREETIRAGKNSILQQVAKGGDIDPSKYINDPELYQYATSMREAPRRPAAESSGNLQRLRSSILNRATTEGVDTNQLIDEAQKNPYLNPGDRDKLVNEIPKLVEGMIAMNDDMVKSAYSTRIGASLEEASKNPMVVLSPTLRSRTVNLYDQSIRNGFNAYYEENGKWPTGRTKQDIVDKAVDRTEAFMQGQLQGSKGQATPPANTSSGRGTPAPQARPTPTQADIDYVKKNPQFRQKFISTFGREP